MWDAEMTRKFCYSKNEPKWIQTAQIFETENWLQVQGKRTIWVKKLELEMIRSYVYWRTLAQASLAGVSCLDPEIVQGINWNYVVHLNLWHVWRSTFEAMEVSPLEKNKLRAINLID